MLKVYSSVQDHNQRFTHKRFWLNELKSKEFYWSFEEHLIEYAPEGSLESAPEESLVRLKKALLKMTSSEASSPEARLSEATSSEAEEALTKDKYKLYNH